MNETELEKLSENEMSQTRGGGQWAWFKGQWIWIEKYDLGGEDTPLPPPPPNP